MAKGAFCNNVLVNYSYFFQTRVLLNAPPSPDEELAPHESIGIPESTGADRL